MLQVMLLQTAKSFGKVFCVKMKMMMVFVLTVIRKGSNKGLIVKTNYE